MIHEISRSSRKLIKIRDMNNDSDANPVSRMNLESLHVVATMISQKREVKEVLDSIVETMVSSYDLALARIWLQLPGDICSTCFLQDECSDRTACLHLVASAADPQNELSGEDWFDSDGFYRRFPLGIRRIGWIGESGKSLKLSDTARDDEWFAKGNWLQLENVKSFSGFPLKFQDKILGVLGVFSRSEVSDQEFAWLQAFADNAAVAITNARAFEEIEALNKKFELENEYLRNEIRSEFTPSGMVGSSPAFQKALEQVSLVAETDTNVLILGESGVGKELVARAVHDRSGRADKPMIKVNCASIPKELFESEFFGHVKGSFTGASRDRAGRFELADGGTLFLDEVGEIPLDMQSKLLRVLQEGAYERIGDEATRSTDVRIVAATNRDLLEEVDSKRFRQDLYYRLSVFPINIPSLRERKEDIPELAAYFLEQSANKLGMDTPGLKQRHIIELQNYAWPGNIRELQNVIERAMILARSGPLKFHLPGTIGNVVEDDADNRLMSFDELKALEKRNLQAVLEKFNWKIAGKDGAAQFMNVPPATLSSRMRAMGIERPKS